MAHSSAPVYSGERFNTHSIKVPKNVRLQFINRNSGPTSHREHDTAGVRLRAISCSLRIAFQTGTSAALSVGLLHPWTYFTHCYNCYNINAKLYWFILSFICLFSHNNLARKITVDYFVCHCSIFNMLDGGRSVAKLESDPSYEKVNGRSQTGFGWHRFLFGYVRVTSSECGGNVLARAPSTYIYNHFLTVHSSSHNIRTYQLHILVKDL